MNELSAWFQDEVYPSQVGKCRFRLVNFNILSSRLELRDQWHAEKSDENANHISSFCNSMFHLLMRLYVLADISLEVKASAMSRPTGVLEKRHDPRAPHQRYEELPRGLAEIRRQRAVAVAELVARPLKKKDVIAEQPNRAAPIIWPSSTTSPLMSPICRTSSWQTMQPQRGSWSNENNSLKRSRSALQSRDTYERRLEVIEELAQRVESGHTPATWLDIGEEDEEVLLTEEQPDETEEAAAVEEAETAAIVGEPEPEAPSSAHAPLRRVG